MSNGRTAEQALKCVRFWYGSRPLLSTELLFRALEAKSGDYPEFPAALLAELCQRLWLFPPSVEDKELFLERLGPGHIRSPFWAQYAEWAGSQADERSYKIPDDILNCAKSDLEKATAEYLRKLFCIWDQSHGVIAFVRKGVEPEADAWENLPPMLDTLLPFRLVAVNLHEPEADFGMRAALDAMNRANSLVAYYLHFPSMHSRLPPWMVGESGALAIWFTMLARNQSLTCRALDVGLSGCLRRYDNPSHLDPDRNTADIIIRKRELFRSARVPVVILPSTWNLGDPPRGFQYWPQSEPLGRKMQELIDNQALRYPDAQELNRIDECVLYGGDDINLDGAYFTVVEMSRLLHGSLELVHHLNVLSYALCCRLGRWLEADSLEYQLLKIPPSIIREYRLELQMAANVASGAAKDRMLKLVAKMRRIEQEWRDSFDGKK